jgi:hypothetical protein
MLEARITSPRGSLYYSGESHPYDFETLWEHVRDVTGDLDGRHVQLELVIDDEGIDTQVSSWIHKVTANGVQVRLLFAHLPRGAH